MAVAKVMKKDTDKVRLGADGWGVVEGGRVVGGGWLLECTQPNPFTIPLVPGSLPPSHQPLQNMSIKKLWK